MEMEVVGTVRGWVCDSRDIITVQHGTCVTVETVGYRKDSKFFEDPDGSLAIVSIDGRKVEIRRNNLR